MKASQANRRIIEQRIAARAATRSRAVSGNVGTNPALRINTVGLATGPVRRTRAVPMTGAQRNSVGRRSEWNGSMYYFTDPAWAYTSSDKHV